MLVDSHCHLNMLDLTPYQGKLSNVIEAAEQNGVQAMLCVGVDLEHAQTVIDIAEQFPNVYASFGIHPSELLKEEPKIDEVLKFAQHPAVIAIGETGLDYYYQETNRDMQQERFRLHIRLAHQVKKPLIIHSRSAQADTIRIMKEEKADQVKGVMHCFTESWEMAQQALALNFYISISGIVTFKNAETVIQVAQKVPLERLLIETDAPYLTPVPYRGKPNAPQYVRWVAEKIAQVREIPFEQVARQTTQNFFQLFSAILPEP